MNSTERAAHFAHLMSLAKAYDDAHGVVIIDRTPAGYGPSTGNSDTVEAWPASQVCMTTEMQRIQSSIHEAETLLKSKTFKGAKRAAIVRSLAKLKEEQQKMRTDRT